MQTKVILSNEEKTIIENTIFFSVKRKIFSKITQLMGEVGNDEILTKEWRKILINANEKTLEPKISKGENYLGLPYLLLDFPKKFEGENQFAIRNFFWWGNYFSTFLLLSGEDLKKFLPSILSKYSLLIEKEIFVSTNTNRWIHSINNENYTPIKNLSIIEFEKIINQTGYLKIATILPLKNIDSAHTYFIDSNLFFQKILK